MKSLSLIAAVADAPVLNAALEGLGRGPDCLSVPLAPSGIEPATHLGCHTYDDELIAWAETAPDLHCLAVDDSASVTNFTALAASMGVEIIRTSEGS